MDWFEQGFLDALEKTAGYVRPHTREGHHVSGYWRGVRSDKERCPRGLTGRGMGRGMGLGMLRSGKVNSPTLAYRTVYGKNPPGLLRGRTDAPKKEWKGLSVDKALKNRWLESINSLPVEIRSTEAGKSALRPAAVVFRTKENCHDCMVKKLSKIPGVHSSTDVGMQGEHRVCVAGKTWEGQKGWETWWNKLPGRIQGAHESCTARS